MPDPSDNIVQLADRVKELSYTEGTNNMVLEGAAAGFSSFGQLYANSGLVYYAITDGSRYEVGSGHYLDSSIEPTISQDELVRYPVQSTNSNNKVNWVAGTKEVYVTYPAVFSVYTASGVDPKYKEPDTSGIAFWQTNNILNYDASGVWDSENKRLGISVDPYYSGPISAIHVGGDKSYSLISASGLRTDASGIVFSGVQYATRQVEPFLKNQLDGADYGIPAIVTNSNSVLQLSGIVNEYILLRDQGAGTVFAGPLNNCGGSCADDSPSFRALHITDIPDLSSIYTTTIGVPENPYAKSGIAFWDSSGVLTWDNTFVWDSANNRIGINVVRPLYTLDVAGGTRITGDAELGGNLSIDGDLDVRGATTYIDSTNVTIWDKQLELSSLSGNALWDQHDAYVDDGGVVVRSSGDGSVDTGDKKWTWRNSSNTWTAKTSNNEFIGLSTSGIIFGNGTQISGAYQAGSGLDLNGFTLDMGNMFVIKDYHVNSQRSVDIHQANNLTVSGVSGINTYIYKGATDHVLVIDPSGLSGVLRDSYTDLSLAVSGYFHKASGNIDSHILTNSGHFHTASGNLHSMIYDSGVTNRAYTRSASGYFHKASGNLHSMIYDSGVYNHGRAVAYTDLSTASGHAESGFLLHTIYGSGAYVLTQAAGGVSSFGKVSVSGSANDVATPTMTADAAQDQLIFASGDDNSIHLSANISSDTVTVSGTHRFWASADNLVSGAINHNDMITFSGGTSINTTLTNNVVKIDWAGDSAYATDAELSETSGNLSRHMLASSGYFYKASGNLHGNLVASSIADQAYTRSVSGYFHKASGHLQNWITTSGFTLRADDDAGAGGELIVKGEVVTISGGDYITTDRDGSDAGKVVVAWSGDNDTYSWFGVPSPTYTAGSAATDIDGQSNNFFVIVNSGTTRKDGSWGKMTLTELDQLVGGGGSASSNDSFGEIRFDTGGMSFSSSPSPLDAGGPDATLTFGTDVKSDLYLETDASNDGIRFSSHGSVSGSLQASGRIIREFAKSYTDAAQASGVANRAFAKSYTDAAQASGAANLVTTYASGEAVYQFARSYGDHAQASGVANRAFAQSYTDISTASGHAESGFLLQTILGSGSYVSGFALNRSAEVLTSGFNNSGFLLQTIYGSGAYLASSASNTFNKVTVSGVSLTGAGALSTLETCVADSTSDTLILTSGDENSIYLLASGIDDSIMISGAHRFWANADNLASGAINHNDMITFSGGASINTTLTNNVVTIDWAGDPAYATDVELMAVSGYFHKSSGNLMGEIRTSGAWNAAYTRSASGWNREYTNAASGWNREYTNAASGWNKEYTSAASGWATYEGISGIELHNGTAGATRKFGISEDWISKPAFTDSLVETINIGFNAGINPGLPNQLNVNLGPRAGAQESNSVIYRGAVNLGASAGAKLEGGQGQANSVHIGYLAGYTEKQEHLPAGFATEQTNVFIGHKAGQNNAFSNNLSIGTFNGSIGSDAINNDDFRESATPSAPHFTNGYMLNIANSIAGKMDSAPTGKKFVIGSIDTTTTFDHTLKLVPAGSMATTSTFHIARDNSQAGNMMTTEVSDAVFFVDEGSNDKTNTVQSETRTENYIINKNGYLTIPMFFRKSDLPTASDNPGMIAMYRTDGDYHYSNGREGHFMVYSDGTVWRATGLDQSGGGSRLAD